MNEWWNTTSSQLISSLLCVEVTSPVKPSIDISIAQYFKTALCLPYHQQMQHNMRGTKYYNGWIEHYLFLFIQQSVNWKRTSWAFAHKHLFTCMTRVPNVNLRAPRTSWTLACGCLQTQYKSKQMIIFSLTDAYLTPKTYLRVLDRWITWSTDYDLLSQEVMFFMC